MKISQLYQWLQEFADSPITKSSFKAAIRGRIPNELWNDGENKETSELKELKQMHSTRLETTPD